MRKQYWRSVSTGSANSATQFEEGIPTEDRSRVTATLSGEVGCAAREVHRGLGHLLFNIFSEYLEEAKLPGQR